MMENDIKEILYTEEQLKQRVAELGAQLTEDYKDKRPLFIGILKGSCVFMSDIIRRVNTYCDIEFMAVSSYGNGTTTTGAVKITRDLSQDIEGRHIIIVEDILDTGVTLSYLKRYMEARNPASIKICTMFHKPERKRADIDPDYVGFTCPNEFIVGYGLDFAELYRNLPYIGVLKESVYENK